MNIPPKSPEQPADAEQRVRGFTFSTFSALGELLELKDLTTGVHNARLVAWAGAIARVLSLSPEETRQVEIAAVLHDLGKIGIPDEILKKPSCLTAEEQAIIRKHPEYGWAAIQKLPGCEMASRLILHHHEMWNGDGYPARLKGSDIPLGARIIAITDAFDAMISDRCYRTGMAPERALGTLQRFAGTQFDPEVVSTFIGCFGTEGPLPGSFVL
jgi:HD-GYP domain-containing protein (c-di-GMP phosphodiesterase class II)